MSPVALGDDSRLLRAAEPAGDGVWIVLLDRSLPAGEVRGVATELAKTYGAELRRVMSDAANAFSATMNEKQAIALSRAPGVLLVEENGRWTLAGSTDQWHLDRIDQTSGTDGQYNPCYTGVGVTAYVVDTGVAAAHSEFQEASGTKVLDGVNFSGDSHSSINPCGGFTNNEFDEAKTYNAGHGTSIASLIAGNTVGVSPGATIVSVKVADCGEEFPLMVTEDLAWDSTGFAALTTPIATAGPRLST